MMLVASLVLRYGFRSRRTPVVIGGGDQFPLSAVIAYA